MSYLDMPDLPFRKPKKIEEIEHLSFDQREGMDEQEMYEHIYEVAASIAIAYYIKINQDIEGCRDTIRSALSEIGGAIGGKFGALMVGSSFKVAEEVTREMFRKDEDIYEEK